MGYLESEDLIHSRRESGVTNHGRSSVDEEISSPETVGQLIRSSVAALHESASGTKRTSATMYADVRFQGQSRQGRNCAAASTGLIPAAA